MVPPYKVSETPGIVRASAGPSLGQSSFLARGCWYVSEVCQDPGPPVVGCQKSHTLAWQPYLRTRADLRLQQAIVDCFERWLMAGWLVR